LPEGGSDIGRATLDRTAIHLALVMGFWNRVQVGVRAQAIVENRVDAFSDPRSQAAMPFVGGAGVGDVGVSLKWAFLTRKRGAMALFTEVDLPSGRAEALYGEQGVAVTPLLVGSLSHGRWSGVVTGGARIRTTPGVLPDARPFGHELIVGLGARAHVYGPFTAIVETTGRIALKEYERDYASSAEVGAGIAVALRHGFTCVAGASSGLGFEAYGSPLVRAFLALRWTPRLGLADTDGDGIRDRHDPCPTEPGLGETRIPGCPDPDSDRDGIPDYKDACPFVPEDGKGVEDKDGCPAPDRDGDGVPDYMDACPDDPAPNTDDGCPPNKKPVAPEENAE